MQSEILHVKIMFHNAEGGMSSKHNEALQKRGEGKG